MVGSSFPYSEFLPKPGAARGVQIDIDGSRLSLRYPMEINMVGDSVTTLRALLPMLQQKTDPVMARGRSKAVLIPWWKTLEARAMAFGGSTQSTARVLGALAAAARQRHHHRGFRVSRQLVCARSQDAPRHESVTFRRPRFAWCRHPLCCCCARWLFRIAP